MNCQAYLVADLFSGSGGSPTGAVRVVAGSVSPTELVAVNRWPVAVETHHQNGQASVKETGAARTAVAFVITTEATGLFSGHARRYYSSGTGPTDHLPSQNEPQRDGSRFFPVGSAYGCGTLHRLNKLVTVSARPTHGLLIGE